MVNMETEKYEIRMVRVFGIGLSEDYGKDAARGSK